MANLEGGESQTRQDRRVRDPKTIEVLELRVGYAKDRFGKRCRQDIKRPDVLAFMRSNATPTRVMTDTSEGVSSTGGAD